MRLSILGNGGGSVGQLQANVNTLHDRISDTINALKRVKVKLDEVPSVPGEASGLEYASSNLRGRISAEENKLESVKTTAAKIDTFLENTIETDRQVGVILRQNQEEFFNDNPWLRPVETEEKSWWEKLIEDLKDFMKSVGEKIKQALAGLWAWMKEHAVELIIGTIAIIVGAVIAAYLTGFTLAAFAAALLAGLKVAILAALVDGLISGLFALFTGEDFWSAFGDGFADGYMWGGLLQMFNGLRQVIPALDNIVSSISAGFSTMMEKCKSFLDDFARGIKNTFAPFVNKITSGFRGLLDNISAHIIKPMRARIDDLFAKLKAKFQKEFMKDTIQKHHLVPWRNKKWTPLYRAITDKYGINLKTWGDNLLEIIHKGRHPSEYHEFILSRLKMIDNIAKGNREKFEKLFKKYIIDRIANDPDILYRKK